MAWQAGRALRGPAGRLGDRGVGRRRGRRPAGRRPGRRGLVGFGDLHAGPGADGGPERVDHRASPPKSVTVGNVSIITGPVPGLFEGAPIGVKAYFAMINAQGGVNGRKLVVDSKDDAFSGQQNMTETQEAINNDFALVGSFSLFDGYGCAALASDTAVPDVSVTLDSGTNALPNDFSAQPLSGQETLGPVAYYKKHYPKDKTVGAIVSDVASAETQMAQQFAGLKSEGYKIAYVDDVNPLAVRLHHRRHQHEEQGRQCGRPDRDRLAGRGHLRRERQHPELAPRAHLLGRTRLRRPVHLPRRRPGGDQRDSDRPGLRPLPRPGRQARCRRSSSSTPT